MARRRARTRRARARTRRARAVVPRAVTAMSGRRRGMVAVPFRFRGPDARYRPYGLKAVHATFAAAVSAHGCVELGVREEPPLLEGR